LPGRTAISCAARPAMTAASSASSRSIQEKLAWESVVSRPRPWRASSTVSRAAIVVSTRRRTSSWCRIASAPAAWARALTLKGWRTASTAARNFGEPIA